MPIYQTAHYQVKPEAVDKVKAAIVEFVDYVRTQRDRHLVLRCPGRRKTTQRSSSTYSPSRTRRPTSDTGSQGR